MLFDRMTKYATFLPQIVCYVGHICLVSCGILSNGILPLSLFRPIFFLSITLMRILRSVFISGHGWYATHCMYYAMCDVHWHCHNVFVFEFEWRVCAKSNLKTCFSKFTLSKRYEYRLILIFILFESSPLIKINVLNNNFSNEN